MLISSSPSFSRSWFSCFFLFFLGSMNTHRPTGTEIRILAGGAGSLVGWLICGILRRTRLQQHAAELGFCFVFCFRWCCTGSVRKNEEEPGLPRDQLSGPKLFSRENFEKIRSRRPPSGVSMACRYMCPKLGTRVRKTGTRVRTSHFLLFHVFCAVFAHFPLFHDDGGE